MGFLWLQIVELHENFITLSSKLHLNYCDFHAKTKECDIKYEESDRKTNCIILTFTELQ